MIKKIIFVCTGNTCRSPMAEGLMKKHCNENNINIEVISRGLFPNYKGANEMALKVMKEYDVDIARHLSKPFNIDEADDDTVILTMTENHKRHLLKTFGQMESSIYTLNEYVDKVGDIDDPFSCGLDVYRKCANEINDALIEVIIKLNRNSINTN